MITFVKKEQCDGTLPACSTSLEHRFKMKSGVTLELSSIFNRRRKSSPRFNPIGSVCGASIPIAKK